MTLLLEHAKWNEITDVVAFGHELEHELELELVSAITESACAVAESRSGLAFDEFSLNTTPVNSSAFSSACAISSALKSAAATFLTDRSS